MPRALICQYKINFLLLDVALAAPGPLAYTRILKGTPKMVFGHNLRYMAPFDFPRAGFCMVLRRASIAFSCLGMDFGGRGRIFGPGVNILARGAFWGQKWGPKKTVLQRNCFLVRIQGDPSCPNEFYGPRDPYGQATLSQNPLKKKI